MSLSAFSSDWPAYYSLRVKSHLDLTWSDWFDDMTITHDSDGETTLSGPVLDQAALYGLLMRLHDLGLTLIAIGRTEDPKGGCHDDH